MSGYPVGTLTQKYLTFSALLTQRSLTALQYLDSASQGKIDTDGARQVETDILRATLQARNDVGSMITDPTKRIPIGTTTAGTTVYFTHDALETMDRVLAVWLYQMSLSATAPATTSQVSGISAASAAEVAKKALEVVDLLGKAAELGSAVNEITDSKSDRKDRVLAFISGLNTFVDVVEGAADKPLGFFLGGLTIGNDLRHIYASYQKMVEARMACDAQVPPICSIDQEERIEEVRKNFELYTKELAADVISIVGKGISIGNPLVGGAVEGVAALWKVRLKIEHDQQITVPDDNTLLSELQQVVRDVPPGGTLFTGRIVSSPTDHTGELLRSVEIDTSPIAQQVPLDTLTDTDGNFEIPTPLPPSQAFIVRVTDPLTGKVDRTLVGDGCTEARPGEPCMRQLGDISVIDTPPPPPPPTACYYDPGVDQFRLRDLREQCFKEWESCDRSCNFLQRGWIACVRVCNTDHCRCLGCRPRPPVNSLDTINFCLDSAGGKH